MGGFYSQELLQSRTCTWGLVVAETQQIFGRAVVRARLFVPLHPLGIEKDVDGVEVEDLEPFALRQFRDFGEVLAVDYGSIILPEVRYFDQSVPQISRAKLHSRLMRNEMVAVVGQPLVQKELKEDRALRHGVAADGLGFRYERQQILNGLFGVLSVVRVGPSRKNVVEVRMNAQLELRVTAQPLQQRSVVRYEPRRAHIRFFDEVDGIGKNLVARPVDVEGEVESVGDWAERFHFYTCQCLECIT